MSMNQFQFAEAYAQLTLHGWGAFSRTLQSARGLITGALIAPFRMVGSVIRAALSPMGMLMGGAALGAGIFAVIKAASTLEEVESKFRAVFKELTEGARQWADEFATSIGRNRTEVMGFMASLQDTFVPLGFAREESQKMSQGLTQLAYDLASFNPTVSNAGEALSLLTSALVGNHEAVRRFGITITETSLKQKMLALGYEGNAAAASNEMKVLARLAMIYDGTTDAQGDLINTADSFKNRMAALWATLTKVAETIGTALMPVVKALGSVMEAVGSVFQRALDGVLPGVADVIGQISETIEAIADGVRNIDFGKWQSQLADLVSRVFAIIKAGLSGLWEVFKRLLEETAGWLQDTLIAAVEGAVEYAQNRGAAMAEDVAVALVPGLGLGLQLFGKSAGAESGTPSREPAPQPFGEFVGWAFDPMAQAMAEFQKQFRQKPSPGWQTDAAAAVRAEMETAKESIEAAVRVMAAEISGKDLQEKMRKAGEKLTESLKTPLETFRDEIVELKELRSFDAITEETFRRGLAAAYGRVPEGEAGREAGREAAFLSFSEVGRHFQQLITKGESEIVKATKEVGAKIDKTREAIEAKKEFELAWQ